MKNYLLLCLAALAAAVLSGQRSETPQHLATADVQQASIEAGIAPSHGAPQRTDARTETETTDLVGGKLHQKELVVALLPTGSTRPLISVAVRNGQAFVDSLNPYTRCVKLQI